jgi:periplasmic protein TonB
MTFFFQRPLLHSFLLHVFFVVLIMWILKIQSVPKEMVEVPVIVQKPEDIQNLSELKIRPKVVLKSVNPLSDHAPSREVFGVNRNAHTDDLTNKSEAFDAKRGNTLTKESDHTVLGKFDSESLPVPTEEYLVSEMPFVLSEVRPVYPKEAREKGIEGSVALNILIDEFGKVRQASIIEGAEIFQAGAVEAIKKFTFSPAKVDGQAVAVRIRYLIKFELEY